MRIKKKKPNTKKEWGWGWGWEALIELTSDMTFHLWDKNRCWLTELPFLLDFKVYLTFWKLLSQHPSINFMVLYLPDFLSPLGWLILFCFLNVGVLWDSVLSIFSSCFCIIHPLCGSVSSFACWELPARWRRPSHSSQEAVHRPSWVAEPDS